MVSAHVMMASRDGGRERRGRAGLRGKRAPLKLARTAMADHRAIAVNDRFTEINIQNGRRVRRRPLRKPGQ
jgi:hypothetical protein